MKVIVGTRELWPTPNLASRILTIMASEDDPVWGIRSHQVAGETFDEITSSTELLVHKIGETLGQRVTQWRTDKAVGSKAGFSRDVAMVKAATGVIAFFGAEGIIDGGTSHVVECALRSHVPVVAYGLAVDGEIIELGNDNFRERTYVLPDGTTGEVVEWHR